MENYAWKTQRLAMRLLLPTDHDEVLQLWQDPRIMRYIAPCQPLSAERAEARWTRYLHDWQQQGWGLFTIHLQQTHRFIGYGGVEPRLPPRGMEGKLGG